MDCYSKTGTQQGKLQIPSCMPAVRGLRQLCNMHSKLSSTSCVQLSLADVLPSLASPTSLGLHCTPGFSFRETSHSRLPSQGLHVENCMCTALLKPWPKKKKIKDHFMPLKLVPHGQYCQILLPALNGPLP